MKPKILPALFLLIALVLGLVGASQAASTTGTWVLYPEQVTSYTVAADRPIAPVGSKTLKNNGRSVIPLKFSLLAAPGPVVFESILSDLDAANDYSYLSFTPDEPLLFANLDVLQADYAFTLGNCHGGALRWSVSIDVDGDGARDGSIFIYYGAYPNFTDCTSSNSQSGVNMIELSDLRYDTTQLGGTFYDSYANALALFGAKAVLRVSLVLDAGWAGDQRVTLTGATVNDNTFVPPSGTPTQTCELPPATIAVTKLTDPSAGPVDNPRSIQPNDDDSLFRVVDCKYIYNLATSSLPGPGTYNAAVVIDGTPLQTPAEFIIREKKTTNLNNHRLEKPDGGRFLR